MDDMYVDSREPTWENATDFDGNVRHEVSRRRFKTWPISISSGLSPEETSPFLRRLGISCANGGARLMRHKGPMVAWWKRVITEWERGTRGLSGAG